MARQLLLRMASAVGLLALAFLILGMDPFLSADPTAGAGYTSSTPAISVNRSIKGDRLPLSSAASFNAPDWDYVFGAVTPAQPNVKPRAQMPVGCDPAFSPISSPSLATVYRRCMA